MTDPTGPVRPEAAGDSEAQFRRLFQLSPHPILVFDLDTLRFLAVNDAALGHYGYSRTEFLAMTLLDIRPPEDAVRLRDYFEKVTRRILRSDTARRGIRHWKKDGSPIDVEITWNTIEYAGREAGLVFVNDVTERLRAEEVLKRSERQLQEAQQVAHLGSWDWDIPTNTVTWSDELHRIYGIKPGEFGSTYESFLERLPPEDRVLASRTVSAAYRDTKPFAFEHRILRPDGTLRWVHARGEVLMDDAGRPVRMIGTGQDITERRQAEDVVRSLMRISRELNSTLDVDALMESLVRESLTLLNAESGFAGLRTPEGMVSQQYVRGSEVTSLRHCWPPGQGLAGWVAVHKAPYLTNDAGNDPQIMPESRERFAIRSALCTPLLDHRGEVLGFFQVNNKKDGSGFVPADQEAMVAVSQAASVAIQNALAYRKIQIAAEALRLAERKYRGLFENAAEGICQTTPDGRFLAANPAVARLLGWASPQELMAGVNDIGRQIYVDAARRDEWKRVLEKHDALRGFEAELRRKDGSTIWVSMSTRTLRDEDGELVHYMTSLQDVTQRRKAEESLREVSGLLLRSQTEERRRIARELHDSTAQSLAALAINLGLVNRVAYVLDDVARRRLADSLELAQQCCREIRTLSYLLHPPALEEADLWSAVRWYAEGFASRSGIHVDLTMPDDPGRLPQEVETALFRIVQESLANIHRHSGSRRARIRIAREAGRVTMIVRDDGRGMERASRRRGVRPSPLAGTARLPMPERHAALGVGITGMRERVRQLGGHIEIDSTDSGTSVTVMLPIDSGH
jgi:PAS domain S-box-containing protein